MRPAWTYSAFLPGGDLSACIDQVLRTPQGQTATALQHLGAQVMPQWLEVELHDLQQTQWAQAADSALWRRSKLGTHTRQSNSMPCTTGSPHTHDRLSPWDRRNTPSGMGSKHSVTTIC
jgi:hypothetical protein